MSAPTNGHRGGAARRVAVRGAAVAAAVTVLAASPIRGQQVGGGALLQRYTFDDPAAASVESLTLVALPFSAQAHFGRAVTLAVAGTWARGTLRDPEIGELTLSGLTDTQLSLTIAARGGASSLTAIALLPTGNSTQSLEESRVGAAVASELLPFALSNWGTGGGFGLSAATAHPVGPVGVGVSVSYLVRQEFEPLADRTFAYRPGDVLRVTAAVDGTVGRASKGTLQLSWHRHGEDGTDAANLFRAGDRLQLLGSLGFPVGATSTGLVYASLHHRSQGTFLSETGELAAQDLVLIGGGFRTRIADVVLQPVAEARLFRREDGVEQGWEVAAGVEAEIDGGGVVFVPALKAHLGNLEVREGIETGFTGLEAGLSIRFGGEP